MHRFCLLWLCSSLLLLIGCDQGDEDDDATGPSPTSTPAASPTPEASPDVTPEESPGTTPDITPSPSPGVTPSPTPQETPETTPDGTPDPTPSDTPVETPDSTPDATPPVTPDETPATPPVTPDETPATPSPTPPLDDVDRDGFSLEEGDCDDTDPTRYPGAVEEAYDDIDQDCNGTDLDDVDQDGQPGELAGGPDCDDEDDSVYVGALEVAYDEIDQDCSGADLTDVDEDTYDALEAGGGDCRDQDPSIHPGAIDLPYDDIDQDCSGSDLLDADGDQHDALEYGGDDCDDTDVSVYPGAEDIPYDEVDQDCAGGDLIDVDGDGHASLEAGGDDCDDEDGAIHPGEMEVPYDGIDQDCADGDLEDQDGDGFAGGEGGPDCDDLDQGINPDAADTPYDGVDQDCADGDLADLDGDGFDGVLAVGGTDCNDGDIAIYPGALEVCDEVDNDCDATIDDGVQNPYYQDFDQDGYGDELAVTWGCSVPEGHVTDSSDCDDQDPLVSPEGLEECNGVDDDCSGIADEGVTTPFYGDGDRDGYGDSADMLEACEPPYGYVEEGNDCDDEDPAINPGAAETCNSIDDNCSGAIDEGVKITYYRDQDNDGYGNASTSTQGCSPPPGYVSNPLDCNDANSGINPAASEVCNGIDEDCDLLIDDGVKTTYYRDVDQDGYGTPSDTVTACSAPTGYVAVGGDCKDTNDSIHPGATEVCNSTDDDCDGTIDEDAGVVFWADVDLDGYGDPEAPRGFCANPSAGYVANDDDCDDTDDAVHPGATEICNEVDDDCDDQIDEEGQLVFYQDLDQDGYGNPNVSVSGCEAPPGYVSDNTDCLDTNDAINPGEPEIANGIDEDCDGEVDEGVYFDSCRAIKQALPGSGTGIYTIDTDGSAGAIQPMDVYCDMLIDGGGWTMVASNSRSSDLLPSSGQALPITTPGYGRNLTPTSDYLFGPNLLTLDYSDALIVATLGTKSIIVTNIAATYPYVSPIEYSYEILRDDFGAGVCYDQARYFVFGCKEKDVNLDADNNENTTGACIVSSSTGDISEGTSFGLGVSEGSWEGYQNGNCVASDVDYYVTYVR